ncbi:uncharacterized protein BJ212DRAFT_1481671 [Suillus subaureus]|uniref:Uncharacterized protein n=1 Tax=Suillus subaureus TaxID=48587 RepID=A0A9P7E9Z6_9AGAM|nr:uncharacterized protein BJ212DRAFT_1481671 [Suillus subaureus]KAG1815135.1 hypothetical protein BJ212DRAFT_1481671 [Suillus subaureus]
MTKSATVKQSTPNKPPKLSVGELTPEVIHDWDNACSTYFMHKGIDAGNQVKMIAFRMLDPHLHTWYLTWWIALDAGTFAKKVLGSQQGSRIFYKWALELQNQNALLYGNTAHLMDTQLCNQLEANICKDLTIPVLRVNLADDLTLKEWIEEVKHLDDKCCEDLASHKKIAKELYKSSKRTTSMSKPSSLKTYNVSSSHLGSLTEGEHSLLMKHRGCFKCRKFYISHQSKDCTDGTPEASSYKMLMELDAIVAKPKTKMVATVRPVGAVMPSTVLDDRSDSEDDMAHFQIF